MASKYLVTKPLSDLMAESESGNGLKRSIGKWGLVALGIGAIIGAGIFLRTAAASAEHAGPAVVFSFVLAGIGCAFAGLCYAEFASMIPIAGSAYTYSYATMGELVAWIIGWDLVLEYALGAATVAIAWSQYFNKLLMKAFHIQIPFEWCHSPLQSSETGVHGIINLPAILILLILSLILIRGMRESAAFNAIIVIVKLAIVILFIILGWQFINPANHIPFIPGKSTFVDSTGVTKNFTGGWMGILSGAGVVFFAYIGFDAVSTAAQETKNPKKDMPFGILVSLLVCTVLYILFSFVLTGVASYHDFQHEGREASVAFAIDHYMPGFSWLSTFVTVAILAGFSSVILVMLLGQSRIFYTMSRDGLVPPVFSQLHSRFSTPYKSNLVFFVFVSLFAAFVPDDIVGEMTSIGTLFAFVLVCIGVVVMRRSNPNAVRSFKVPLSPVLPILGAAVCLFMIYGLGWLNWVRLAIWMAIGFVVYFGYGIHHSRLQQKKK